VKPKTTERDVEEQAWTWLRTRFGWFDRRAASPCREAQLAVWNKNPAAPWTAADRLNGALERILAS